MIFHAACYYVSWQEDLLSELRACGGLQVPFAAGLTVPEPDSPESASNRSAAASGSIQPSTDASEGAGDGMHVDINQDLLQPPQYEVEDAMSLQDAVARMLMLGGPFALVFAAIALILWRRMSMTGQPFQAISSHEI